jgi:hypothetical protein
MNMSVELLESIKQQGANLSAQEKRELGQYFSELAEQEKNIADLKRRQVIEWLQAHREEYAGSYVALDGDRLIGQGKTMLEACEQAHRRGVTKPFLMRVTSENEVLFAGW